MRTCLRYALPLVFVLLGAVLSRQTEPSVVVSREELTATSFRVPALRVRPRGPVRGRVLLAHGVTASKETMFRLAEAFATAGYECLSVDFPGHGESRRAFGNLEDAEETLVAAARALGTVDVVVGFSMGAGVAARCIEARRLSPGRFIALGATPHGADLHLLGAHDELVDAPLGAIVSPWSDHALEPFDPVLVNAAVSWVASNTAGAAPTWWAVRLAGVLLLLAGTLFGTALALPRFPRRAWPGALTGLAVIAALGLGIDGTWACARPSVARMLQAGTVAALALAASLIAALVAARVSTTWRATLAHATFAVLAETLALSSRLAGFVFPALCTAIIAVLLAFATVVGALVERLGRSSPGASIAFALLVGWAMGQWAPVTF